MYRLVQHYGTGNHHRADGTVVAVPALIEDSDGLRLLVVADLVPAHAWTEARSSGAAGLLRLTDSGVSFTPAERFASRHRHNMFAAAFELDEQHWMPCEYGPSLLDLMEQWEKRNQGDNPFVHLHTHSEYSQLDGYSTMAEIGEQVTADRQRAVGITDHGNCAGHPDLQKMANDTGIKPIFGMEAYFVEDRLSREDRNDYRHLCVWATDEQGLHNLWALSTEGYRDGFYAHPRIDWDSLRRHRSGLIVSTACLRGPLLEPFGRGDYQQAMTNLLKLQEIFGDDLYVELHVNQLPQQVTGNQWLIDLAREHRLPLIAAVDSHYARADQKTAHQVWLAMQTNRDVADETSLFGGEQDYHLMTTAEVRQALSYLPEDVVTEAIANTGRIADRCTAEIVPQVVKPVYSKPTPEHPDPARHDIERFADMIAGNWATRVSARVADEAPYFERGNYEFPMLIDKGYAGYYLITADFVQWAKDHGILVGPGRGSGAGSLAAYVCRITEIDPVRANLNVDRFMTPGRKSLPDFDIDFPSSKAEVIIGYVQQRWGPEHVARVGSHMRLKNKSAFKDVQRAIASRLPGESFRWVENISALISAAEASTAGLGLSWDELMDQVGELLEPYRQRMPELFEYAEVFRSRLKTYGKHAAGLIIDPEHSLEATLPMRSSGDGGPMVTQWDMEALDWVGKVKFDFLMIRNLDTIQDTIDDIKADLEITIDPYSWTEEYEDPLVFEQLSEGWTAGVFQIETSLGTRTTKQIKPISIDQLSDVITIGRPGPLRSGLDKVYMRRKNGEEPVSLPDPRLEGVLDRTYGVMLYQEDIMAICRVLAGYDADEADHVRKILGKKKIELVEAEGQKFVERAAANGTNRAVATEIWAQMAEFAKYSFNRAHAYSYATLGYWYAWLKTHFVKYALKNTMATVDKDRIPQFVAEARRLGYQVLPPDINESRLGFAASGLTIRYGFSSLPGIGEAASGAIVEGQPYSSYEDFLERKGSACNMGHVKRLVALGAFDSLHPNRRALEARLIDDTTGVNDQCRWLHPDRVMNEHNLPCVFDWASEPKKVGRTGKPLKTQPAPPKRCTKACRHYEPKQPTDYSNLPNYSDEEIRDREAQTLGIYLSSSPFDHVPIEMMTRMWTADDLMVSENGTYPVVAVITNMRPDSRGRDFGFASFLTPSGQLETIVFSKEWAKYRPLMNKGGMVFLTVIKTADDRYRLDTLDPVYTHTKEEPHGSTQERPVGVGAGQV